MLQSKDVHNLKSNPSLLLVDADFFLKIMGAKTFSTLQATAVVKIGHPNGVPFF